MSNLMKCCCSSGVSMTGGGKKSIKTAFLKGLQRSIDIILNDTPASSYFSNCDCVSIFVSKRHVDQRVIFEKKYVFLK